MGDSGVPLDSCGIIERNKLKFDDVIKMIDITAWMSNFLQTLNKTFVNRVWFVGLQGSYGRGEATETSDIDVVVILDELSAMDIKTYNDMLDTLPHRELICGFLSGKSEIMNWEPSDLFQFCNDTMPIKGSLDEVLAVVDESAVNRAIKIGACNIFHGCVHNMLYEKDEDILLVVSSDERTIVENFLSLKNGKTVEFNLMSETLFAWSKKWIAEKYKSEAKEKWGNTSAYKEHIEKTKNYSKQKWNALSEDMDHIMSEFAKCMKNEAASDSKESQALVKTLQNHITENYYTCTDEILAGLGKMYVADERFKNNIDKHGDGTAAFVSEAIEVYCCLFDCSSCYTNKE